MGHLKAEEAKEYTISLLGIFSTKGVDSFEKGERERNLNYGCRAMSLHLQTLADTYANYFHYKQGNRSLQF